MKIVLMMTDIVIPKWLHSSILCLTSKGAKDNGLSLIQKQIIIIIIVVPINRRALITHNAELEWIVSFNANMMIMICPNYKSSIKIPALTRAMKKRDSAS